MEQTAEALLAAVLAQRKSWVDLGDGKAVQIRRPAQAELSDFLRKDPQTGKAELSADLEQVKKYTCGWRNFRESDLMPGVGGDAQAPFSPALWAVVVEDRLDWSRTVARAMLDRIVEHMGKESAAAGN